MSSNSLGAIAHHFCNLNSLFTPCTFHSPIQTCIFCWSSCRHTALVQGHMHLFVGINLKNQGPSSNPCNLATLWYTCYIMFHGYRIPTIFVGKNWYQKDALQFFLQFFFSSLLFTCSTPKIRGNSLLNVQPEISKNFFRKYEMFVWIASKDNSIVKDYLNYHEHILHKCMTDSFHIWKKKNNISISRKAYQSFCGMTYSSHNIPLMCTGKKKAILLYWIPISKELSAEPKLILTKTYSIFENMLLCELVFTVSQHCTSLARYISF